MRTLRTVLVALALLIICKVQAPADDSAMWGIGGGAVAPMTNHPSIRMVRETVKIKLTDRSARVNCEFVFKNEGKQCTAKMGFPEKTWASGDSSARGTLSGFRSWVDGKPVKCVHKPGKVVQRKGSDDEESCDSWYVKDVPFAAGQTRTVVDEYSTRLGGSCSSLMTPWETPWDFDYILRTGANWKGPIGKAVIVVDTSAVTADHYDTVPYPPGFVKAKTTISWTLTNFEPTKDISVALVPRYPKLNGKDMENGFWTPLSRVAGVTMTGMEFLHKLGAKIEYPSKQNALVIAYNGHRLRLTYGSKTADLDGSNITLQAAVSTEQCPVQVPAASVVRALGGKAWYSQKEHRLVVWLKDCSTDKR